MIEDVPWIAWLVVVPLAGAVLAILVDTGARWVAAVTAVATVAVTIALIAQVVEHGVVHHAVGGWGVPLGISLRADGLAAVMLAAVATVSSFAIAYAIAGRTTPHRFYALWLLGWASLAALAVSADTFNLYVTLELLTLVSVALVALPERSAAGRSADERATLAAALRYVLFALVGSLAYLLGIVLLYAVHPVLDLATLGTALEPGPVVTAAVAAMTVGLAFKSALFPLHGWLPGAYAGAPAVGSVVLAALVGKASFYVLLRLWFEVFPAVSREHAATILGILGAAGALWGALLACRQANLKRLLAYSSVGQVGYLFLVFPLATRDAAVAAMYLVVSHAVAKAAMFMVAGSITEALGTDDLAELRRVAPRRPIAMFTFGLAGLTLMGLPPSGGFVAKWLLLRESFETGQWWWAIPLIGGGFLAAAYVFRVVSLAFARPDDLPPAPAEPPRRGVEIIALVLALISIALGVAAAGPLALLGDG